MMGRWFWRYKLPWSNLERWLSKLRQHLHLKTLSKRAETCLVKEDKCYTTNEDFDESFVVFVLNSNIIISTLAFYILFSFCFIIFDAIFFFMYCTTLIMYCNLQNHNRNDQVLRETKIMCVFTCKYHWKHSGHAKVVGRILHDLVLTDNLFTL